MKNLVLIGAALFMSNYSFAQTEFVLTASEFIPEEEGFFRAGVTYDFNGDGLDDFINGCPGDLDFEDYERRDPMNVTYDLHNESGEQFGFTYKNVMILPVCDAKYESNLEPPLSHGFVQLRPGIDTLDEDLAHSYILSPEISNLQSITIETSADVSIQESRQIPYNIEFSLDGGETFEFQSYIPDVVRAQGGSRVTYDSNHEAFAAVQNASKNENIVLRFITNADSPELGALKGQYVKIHKIIIVADSAQTTFEPEILANKNELPTNLIQVRDRTVFVKAGLLRVYTFSGKLIGQGSHVRLNPGLYVVTTDQGIRKKVLITQ